MMERDRRLTGSLRGQSVREIPAPTSRFQKTHIRCEIPL